MVPEYTEWLAEFGKSGLNNDEVLLDLDEFNSKLEYFGLPMVEVCCYCWTFLLYGCTLLYGSCVAALCCLFLWCLAIAF